jgi:hypothetical protein
MLALLSPELRLMLAPARTYRQLRHSRGRAPNAWWPRWLLVALVAGTSVAIAATGRVGVGLVVSCTLCWAVAPATQVLALAAVAPRSPSLPFGRLLELFLLAHAPWSLWLLGLSLAAALSFPEGSAGWTGVAAYAPATALLPLLWTLRIVFCFFREVLELPTGRALVKTAGYELAVWVPAFAFVWWAAQLWPRVAALL